MARPEKFLNDAQLAEVETLASVLTAAQMADYFGIGRTTFFSIMARNEEVAERYKRGKAKAVGAIAQSLIAKARAGDTASMIFYLKTQGGWREHMPVQTIEDTPQGLDLTRLSDDALQELAAAMGMTELPDGQDGPGHDRARLSPPRTGHWPR